MFVRGWLGKINLKVVLRTNIHTSVCVCVAGTGVPFRLSATVCVGCAAVTWCASCPRGSSGMVSLGFGVIVYSLYISVFCPPPQTYQMCVLVGVFNPETCVWATADIDGYYQPVRSAPGTACRVSCLLVITVGARDTFLSFSACLSFRAVKVRLVGNGMEEREWNYFFIFLNSNHLFIFKRNKYSSFVIH